MTARCFTATGNIGAPSSGCFGFGSVLMMTGDICRARCGRCVCAPGGNRLLMSALDGLITEVASVGRADLALAMSIDSSSSLA